MHNYYFIILLFIISHLILLYPCNAHINNNHHHRQQQDDYHHHHHNRTHKCIHDHVKDIINNAPKLSTKPDLYSNLNYIKGTKRRNLNTVPWLPLRIQVIFKLENTPLSTAKQNFLRNKLLPESVNYWNQALAVRRPAKLLVEGNCTHVFGSPYQHICGVVSEENYCADIKIDNSLVAKHAYYDQPGETAKFKPATDGAGTTEADFILYVTASSTTSCGTTSTGDDTLAYAAMCRSDSNDRPVMGYANFCPNMVDDTVSKYWQQFKTAKHEIAHALGFSSNSWSLMRNSDGTQRTTDHTKQSYTCANGANPITQTIDVPSTNTISTVTKRGKTVNLIVTERVKEVARAYYGCNSIEGAELEDQIGPGCLGSHWEERTLFDELMSPLADNHYAGNRISKFTLALFEDMGWYKANYSIADALQFGKNAGCDFLNEKCINPTNGKPLPLPKNTFCSPASSNGDSCTFDFRGIGSCQSGSYSGNLPTIYQYFPSTPNRGGTMAHVDYCPMILPYSNTDCQDSTQNTLRTQNVYGFLYSLDSFCANSSLFDIVYQNPNLYVPNCFKMKCYSNPNTIQVTIRRKSGSVGCIQGIGCGADEDISFNCETDGQVKTVAGFNGEFICPKYDDICSQKPIGINLPGLPETGDSGSTKDGTEGTDNVDGTTDDKNSTSRLNGEISFLGTRVTLLSSFIMAFILSMMFV